MRRKGDKPEIARLDEHELPTESMEWIQGGEPNNPGHYYHDLGDGTAKIYRKCDPIHLPNGTSYVAWPNGIDARKHREGGPATALEDGTEMWYQHNKLHKIGGPGVIFPDGTELWYKDGKLHMEDDLLSTIST